MVKKLLFILLAVAVIPAVTFATTPSAATWKLYKVVLYESADCTGTSITVFEDANGVSKDFSAGPSFGVVNSGISAGTYNCVGVQMSDNVTFTTPATIDAADQANCTASTDVTIDVCNASVGASGELLDGTAFTCDATNQTIGVYISTFSTSASNNNAFTKPSAASSTNGMQLTSALTITDGQANTGTFVVDVTDKIDGTGGSCDMQQPVFGFN